MKRTPWMPFYCDDFVSSTADMSCEEVGAYTRLLCYLWTRGPLPIDDKIICRIGGCRLQIWRSIRTRFSVTTREDGSPGLSQTRLEAERFKRSALASERAESGRRGAATRWHGKANGTAIGKSMPCHNHNHIGSSNVTSTTRERTAAPAPLGAGLPRLATLPSVDEPTEPADRNRAFIDAHRKRGTA